MAIKLSTLEADLLVRAVTANTIPGLTPKLSATGLQPSEKAACQRLVKKGLMTNIMDTFYEANDAGRERAKSIY